MRISLIALLTICISSLAQGPQESAWSLFASGVGQKLAPGMDPCWITYTVAPSTHPRFVANVEMGTMAVIVADVTWYEATAQQRRFGQYFDDEPDGTFKLTPCRIDVPQGTWSGWGTMTLRGGSSHLKGTYTDTYDKGQLGTVEIFKRDGVWVGKWAEPAIGRSGTLYDIVISADGKSLSGKYDTTADGGKGNWHKGASFRWTFSKP